MIQSPVIIGVAGMIRMIASTPFFAALDCRLMMMLLMTSGLLRYGSKSKCSLA